MLTSVPTAINQSNRQVVLRHPNSFDAVVSRKRVVRVELVAGAPGEMGGNPTLGGMGVLRSEDEADYEYDELGPAKLLFAGPGPFQPQDIIERDNGLVAETQREVLIECVAKPGETGFFVADTSDLVSIMLGPGVVMVYDVATVSGTVNIPPYTRRLVLNPRDDLNYIEPFTD